MYQTRYIVVAAQDAKEACDLAESILWDSINDSNNHFEICGSVGENRTTHIEDVDNWEYDPTVSFSLINRQLRKELQQQRNEALNVAKEALQGQEIGSFLVQAIADTSYFRRITRLKIAITFLAECSRIPVSLSNFDVAVHDFLPDNITEHGVSNYVPKDNTDPKFVVIVNIHS